MDQYVSAVIITAMTGVFSLITLIIQKKQDKIINKIDEQTVFIDKEKRLRQKLIQQEKERELIIQNIMILILDTNLDILKSAKILNPAIVINDNIFRQSDDLKQKFSDVSNSIKEIGKEYEMVLDMNTLFQNELERVQHQQPHN